MTVEIDIVYEGGLRCSATHGPSGDSLATDAPTDNGGRGQAFSPTDLVATALGTCMLTLMGLRATERDLDLEGTRVQVTKEMVADPHRRIAALRVRLTVPEGRVPRAEDRAALREAAEGCPVCRSLGPDVEVDTSIVFLGED